MANEKVTLIFSGVVFAIIGFLAIVIIENFLVDETGARRILEQHGYTEIQFDGHAWFACSQDDLLATKFNAVAPLTKQPIEGVVCSGLFIKNSTIRFK